MRTFLCRTAEIEDRAARGFPLSGETRDTIFVVRRNDVVTGWLNACPHVSGAPLAWRKDAYLSADSQAIVCYGHGAIFDVETGVCTHGPCIGQALTPVMLEQDPQGALWLVDNLPITPQT